LISVNRQPSSVNHFWSSWLFWFLAPKTTPHPAVISMEHMQVTIHKPVQ
jgi:hypothetical protein